MDTVYRVKNSKDETCGFLMNGKYYTYGRVLSNISRFPALRVSGGNIEAESGQLPVIQKRDINNRAYDELAEKNRLKRDVQQELRRWKEEYSAMVLYLVGARQVGKTTELFKFAYQNYEQIIYINLASPRTAETLEKCIINNNVVLGLAEYCEFMQLEKFEDDQSTLLIIDEIQESVNIYNSIRAFQSGLNCHIAVTGSYLGKTINAKYFKPAGNIWRIELLPLSFSEFCDAFECRSILETMDIHGEDTRENYEKIYGLYSVYIQIGGYPLVVSRYKESKNIDSCMDILEQLVNTFTEESETYFMDPSGKARIVFDNVYTEAFRSIAYEKKGTSSKEIEIITDFIRESTQEAVSRAEVNKAMAWLKYSGIIGSCNLYNQGNVSDLLLERRFYFMDCGIANCISGKTSVDNNTVRGILTENFAYTELYRLYKTKAVKGEKPCCSVYGKYELDFMIVDRNDVRYGIEIKSSDAGKPTSLLVYLNDRKIDKGYLAGKTRGGVRKEIYSIPIYAVGCRFPYD